jgi:uncharacterized protein (UPF0332 family)
MDERFDNCIKDGKLKKVKPDIDMMFKEMEAAESDLMTANRSLKDGNPKWAIIQCYYSMFHTSKALALSKGYREKSHACLSIALKALFIDSSALEKRHFDRFRDCMALREDADYGLVYSENSAKSALEWAKDFLTAADSIITKPE